jgi:branched-chain amino acid transport system permease protein
MMSATGVVRALSLALLAAAAVLPLFGGTYFIRLAIEAMLLGALALSVDVLLGGVGLLSLGQAAFFGVAAYGAALLFLHVTHSFWLVAVMTLAGVGLFALVVGAIAIRARGVYFALITFGLAEVLGQVANNTRALGGSDGLIGLLDIPLADSRAFYYAALAAMVLVYWGVRRALDTPFGSVLRAIRDNPDRVAYLGYDPFWYKLGGFVLAAEIAAIGGLVYPLLRGFVAPNLFSFEVSTKAVVMALLGGLGTLIGPLLGGAVITFLDSVVSSVTERHLAVLGVIFVVFVLFCPDGLVGLAQRRVGRRA